MPLAPEHSQLGQVQRSLREMAEEEAAPFIDNPQRVSETVTGYAVKCITHGQVNLTEGEYCRQMLAADAFWVCPLCNGRAWFLDEVLEAWMEDHPQEGGD